MITDPYRSFFHEIDKVVDKARVYDSINFDSAQAYCQKYLLPQAWGKNVINEVIADALKIREELEALKARTKTV